MNKIYVIVKGGVVDEVRSTVPGDIHIFVIDRDVLDDGIQTRNNELLKGTEDLCKVFEA